MMLCLTESADGQRVLAQRFGDGRIIPRPQPRAVLGVDGPYELRQSGCGAAIGKLELNRASLLIYRPLFRLADLPERVVRGSLGRQFIQPSFEQALQYVVDGGLEQRR